MKKAALSILIFSLFLIFHLSSFISPAFAQTNTTIPVSNTNPDVPNNLHNWTQTVMIEVMSSLTCQIAGVDPINPKQPCLGTDSKSGKIGFLPSPQTGGAIGFMGTMISTLYTPPLHTGDYFKDLAANFGISKKTYAANNGGTGFQSLTPLIGIWSAFRNIVYLLLVIVFVVIGLAIMLRVKIDPRTVMTIQNQIPKIIVGILAVTFSFAIAGFLIDMMWVIIYLFFGIFSGISPEIAKSLEALNPSSIQGQSAIGVASHISPGGVFVITHNAANSVKDAVQSLLGIKATWTEIFNPLAGITNWFDPAKRGSFMNWAIDIASYASGIATYKLTQDVGKDIDGVATNLISAIPFIGTYLGNAAQAVTGTTRFIVGSTLGGAAFVGMESFLRIGLPYIIAYLIIIIAVFVALFRLWFTLIMAYVQILLSVVLAPFWIIGGIIPGSPISLGGWFKNMAANLLAFPVVIAMFMLGKVFMDTFGKIPATGQNFLPPLIGDPGNSSLIGALIGLGILLMTPNVVNMLKAALKAPKTDTGIGAALGAGAAIPMNAGKSIGGMISTYKYDISGKPGDKGTGLPRVFMNLFR